MWKSGIYNLNCLQNSSKKTLFGATKTISVTILRQINSQEKFTEKERDEVLRDFTDDRGAFKRTYDNRFDEFDASVLKYLNKKLTTPPYNQIRILDTGVSDGKTAVNFFHKISDCFKDVIYHATDYDPYVKIIDKGKTSYSYSKKGNLIEIMRPPFVFRVTKPDNKFWYPINYLIYHFLASTHEMPTPNDIAENASDEISLFCTEAKHLAEINTNFQLEQFDLLQEFPEPHTIDIFRAMNVLNPTYFNKNELDSIAENIYSAMTLGGVLITGSNQDAGSIVNGTVFEKSEGAFKIQVRSGDGSPVESTFTEFENT